MYEDLTADDLVERCRTGDSRAEEELVARYSRGLIRLAERHLSAKAKVLNDGEDIVQSVFRTFFRRNALGEFHIESSAKLWYLLARITYRKSVEKGRMKQIATEGPEGDCPSREPRPDDLAVVEDLIERLLQGLTDLHQNVLMMLLQGTSEREIAGRLGVSRQNVQRIHELFRQRLTKVLRSSAD